MELEDNKEQSLFVCVCVLSWLILLGLYLILFFLKAFFFKTLIFDNHVI